MAKRRPKGKVEVTLYFDDQNQAEWFRAGWLDGGAEEQCFSGQATTESWGKNWFYIKSNEYACTACGYLKEGLMDDCWEDAENEKLKVECENCNQVYEVENPRLRLK